MKRYSIFYFIGQAFRSLWRNGVMTLASIAVLMSCLVLMGGFSLLVANLNLNLSGVNSLNEIVIFLENDATEEDVAAVSAGIEKLRPLGITDVKYVSKAQALENMREKYKEYQDIYSDITDETNPLSDSFSITYGDKANGEAAEVETIEYQLKQIEQVRKVSSRIETASSIEKIKNGVSLIFVWFLIILFVVSIFIIINTIKLAVYARRDEIAVMRYVGASRMFIAFPFVIEGITIGVVAAGIAYFIEEYMYNYVLNMMSSDYAIISMIGFSDVSRYLLIGFFGLGILTGVFGSVISLQKHVEV